MMAPLYMIHVTAPVVEPGGIPRRWRRVAGAKVALPGWLSAAYMVDEAPSGALIGEPL